MPSATGRWLGDDFWVVWEHPSVVFEFRRAREHTKDPVELRVMAPAGSPAIYWDRLSPGSHRARQGAAQALTRSYPMDGWPAIVDAACRALADALVAVAASEVATPLPPSAESWVVPSWIPRDMPTIIYGDGGSGKGFWGLGLTLSAITGHPFGDWSVRACRRALWLDWEYGTASSFRHRLWGFLETGTPDPGDRLRYLGMTQGAHEASGAIRREISRHSIDLVVVDSLAPAAGPEPETASAAVQTLRAICAWGVTALVIAHVPKADGDATHDFGPYGSVFNKNLARSTIRLTSEPDDEGMVTTVTHRKANEGPRVKQPSGFRFLFGPDGGVMVRAAEPDRARASLSVRIEDALQSGPQTPKSLAELTEATPDALRRELSRMKIRGIVIPIEETKGGRGSNKSWSLTNDEPRQQPRQTEADPDEPPF